MSGWKGMPLPSVLRCSTGIMPSKQLPWTTSIARTASGVEQRGIEDTIGGRSNQIDGLKLTLTGVVCYYVSAFEIL